MKKKVVIPTIIILLIAGSAILVRNYYHHPSLYDLKTDFYTWAGDTQLMDSEDQIPYEDLVSLSKIIKPGDILLNRSNYYLSNIGIPGFWTHAAIYVGRPEKWDFTDPDCINWIEGNSKSGYHFDAFIKEKFPERYNILKENKYCCIESVSDGVILSSFITAAGKDGLVVLRPKVDELTKAKAIYSAFEYINTPYDFGFDFSSDTTLSCTELVYLIYEESQLFPVFELFGKPFSTANEIVEHYHDTYGNDNQKLEYIFLYDGEKSYGSNDKDGHDFFINSWEKTRF